MLRSIQNAVHDPSFEVRIRYIRNMTRLLIGRGVQRRDIDWCASEDPDNAILKESTNLFWW